MRAELLLLLVARAAAAQDAGLCLRVVSDGDGGRLESWAACFNPALQGFTAAVWSPYVTGTTAVFSPMFSSGTEAVSTNIIGMQYPSGVGADVTVASYFERTAGSLTQWRNYNTVRAQVDPHGMFVGSIGGLGSFSAFLDGSGVSGHVSLTVADGLYPVIMSRLPVDYYGRHGGVTFASEHAMTTGSYLISAVNGETEGMSDLKLLVSAAGGVVQSLSALSLASFPPCVNDGGGYVHLDGGISAADRGEMLYAIDTAYHYSCYPGVGSDGGYRGWEQMEPTR